MLRQKRSRAIFRPLRILAAVAFLTLASTALYATVIKPHFSHAATNYMTAFITDDNGEVDFSPGTNASANFSYIRTGSTSADSQFYNAKVTLRNLPYGDKKLVIHLPAGMSWLDDGSADTNLASQLDGSVQKVALDHEKILGYTFPNSGDRVYNFYDGTSDLTVSFKVKADAVLGMTHVDDAIVPTLYLDNEAIETSSIDVNIEGAASTAGKFYSGGATNYVNRGDTYQSNGGYYRLIYSNLVLGRNSVKRLIKNVKVYLHVDDPSLGIILQGADATWSIDDSNAANGDYILTETYTSPSSGDFYMPYAVVVPDDAPDDKAYSVQMRGETTYYREDGSEETIEFGAARVFKFVVLPQNGAVTIGWSSLNPAQADTAHDLTFNTTAYISDGSQAPLGYTYINNKGGEDSKPLRMKMTFDTSVLGVLAVDLSCAPNSKITTIHAKSASGVEADAEVNINCSNTGYGGVVTFQKFGFGYYDYIKEISYDFGVIPAGTQIKRDAVGGEANGYIGRILSEDPGVATFELFEIDNPANTTGVAKVTTRRTNGGGTLDITNLGSQAINAGKSLKFSINVMNWAGSIRYNNTVESPVLYIRQTIKNAAGEYLPISNLKITNGSARGNEDITSLFGQVTYTDTDTARVYKIDGRNVPDGKASLASTYISADGKYYNNIGINVSWTVDTDLTTPDQQYPIDELFFAQDPDRSAAITTHFRRGDPFGISGSANNTIYAATTNYYQVRGWASIGVENAGKHTSSDAWLTWAESSNSITIGSVEGSLADLKITMSNNSGVRVPGPTIIYSPIPKAGENWGALSLDNKAFEYSMALVGALSNPDAEHFTVAYGKNVTPTDDGLELDAQSEKFTTDTTNWTDSDWAEVNCVKLVATDVPANTPGTPDFFDFVYRLKVVDPNDEMDGSINTWRPAYYQMLTNTAGDIFAGWYRGSYVSVKLADGKVSGQLFIDANENGKKDASEQALKEAGWQISLYDAASNRLVQTTETNANGEYSFVELSLAENGYYATVTNKHPIGDTAKEYIFAPKARVDGYTADNQAEGDRNSTPAHATAYVGPITPNHTVGAASYNIGLVEYIANDAYSVTINFDDQGNRYQTRPSSIGFNFTADANNSQSVSSGTSFTANLPRYDRGTKLEYTLTAPDIDNYTKKVTDNGGHNYTVVYTLKTAKLTVRHLKNGSNKELASTETSTVYFTQSYETGAADLGVDYELDHVEGNEAGTISGDVEVVYYYNLKRGTVVTHHYLVDSTDEIFPDSTEEYDYGSKYETKPITSMPDEYLGYGPVSTQPENYRGELHAPLVEVAYYYQAKTPQLNSEITIEAPDAIDDYKAKVPYEIKYKAILEDYAGSATVTIVNELPYDIDESQSDLDGGVYDTKSRTITWTEEIEHDSYLGDSQIELTHNISIVYKNAAKDELISKVRGDIKIRAQDDTVIANAKVLVRLPEEVFDNSDNPFTGDSIVTFVIIGSFASLAGFGLYRITRRR